MALLRATGKQNDELPAIPPEIDAVAEPKINPAFENAAANPFHVRQVAIRNSLQRGCHLCGGLHVECAAACTLSARSQFVNGLRPSASIYSRTSSTSR